MKSPHILFMARRFPPSIGGMERFAADLSVALGNEAKLSLVTWGKRTRMSIIIGLPYIFFKSFWQLLVSRDIAVIHCQDGVTSPLAWLLARVFRKPYVVVVHGLDLTYKNKFYQAVNIWFIRRADKVIAISQQTRDEAVKRGVSQTKVVFIPLGITDSDQHNEGDKQDILASINLSQLTGKHILLTVGRLVERKGVAWFINEVLPSLYRKNPAVRYVVIGDGIDRPNVEAAIRQHDLQKIVLLLGTVDDATKQALYQTSDIFVMPNVPVKGDMEGFGIVAQEAAAAGLPVVASKLEGIVNAIHDQRNGQLLSPQDATTYAKVILELLDDEPKRRTMGRQARTYTLKHFGWDSIAASYAKEYADVAIKHKPRNLKFLLSIVILTVTFGAFAAYISQNQDVLTSLLSIQPLILLQLVVLYGCMFSALVAVLYFSIIFYDKKLSWGDNFLISSYSSLTNFFGPTQAGSGVRALYLKAKLKLGVKDFVFVSLIYYAFYATLSMLLLLAGAGLWLWAFLAASAVALFSIGVVRWYKKRSKLSSQRRNTIAVAGIFIGTLLQLFFQSAIYFIEVASVDPAATYSQALSFTGAANFSLFVSLTPGAIGIREAFLLFSQNLHHISSDVIVSAGVLDRAVYVVFLGLLFLCVTALHGRKKIQTLRSPE